MTPSPSTALRTCPAVFDPWKAPFSGEMPFGLRSRIKPTTDACRASTAAIESAALT
jgi:hypothetical protein